MPSDNIAENVILLVDNFFKFIWGRLTTSHVHTEKKSKTASNRSKWKAILWEAIGFDSGFLPDCAL